MSIWCTIYQTTSDDHDHHCARWIPSDETTAQTSPGRFFYRTDGSVHRYEPRIRCTCGAGPLTYQRSHVVPQSDHLREGHFDLASIASHIGPDGHYREDEENLDETHLPYLRVGLHGSDAEPDVVVLDIDQARAVHETIGWFLENVDRA